MNEGSEMKQARHICFRIRIGMRGLLATLLAALALAAQGLTCQAQDRITRIEGHADQARQPLTAAEIDEATAVLEGDDRARTHLAKTQRVRTVLVERHEEDKDAPTDQRRVNVVKYNYDTNETISAVVTLRPRAQAEQLSVTRDQPPGLGPEEVEEARQLALTHPTVQAALRAAGLAGRESELIVTHIRVQPAAPGDRCSTDRCVVMFFNTRNAVLGVEPIVNLSTREVTVP
jgi:hypothetical protein